MADASLLLELIDPMGPVDDSRQWFERSDGSDDEFTGGAQWGGEGLNE